MIKITDVVLDLIQADKLALEALRASLLNLSAYAEKIHANIENTAKKQVKKGTIVVALSRIAKHIPASDLLTPDVRITNLSVTSSLAVLSFCKTPDLQRKIAVLYPFTLTAQDIFSITEGPAEITIICPEKSQDKLLKHFEVKPEKKCTDAVAITCEIDEKIIDTPNILYVLFNALAAKRINLIEIVSTFSEIVFLVKHTDMENTLSSLNVYFRKEKI